LIGRFNHDLSEGFGFVVAEARERLFYAEREIAYPRRINPASGLVADHDFVVVHVLRSREAHRRSTH
jgi:hypothetical protein